MVISITDLITWMGYIIVHTSAQGWRRRSFAWNQPFLMGIISTFFQHDTSTGTGIFHCVRFGCFHARPSKMWIQSCLFPLTTRIWNSKIFVFGHLAKSRLARIDKVPIDWICPFQRQSSIAVSKFSTRRVTKLNETCQLVTNNYCFHECHWMSWSHHFRPNTAIASAIRAHRWRLCWDRHFLNHCGFRLEIDSNQNCWKEPQLVA